MILATCWSEFIIAVFQQSCESRHRTRRWRTTGRSGAVPTPARLSDSINPITAGTLTHDEVKTIIAQAVSAAASINRAITVAVTDREGNVLGLFAMTGAPTMMQIRGGGPCRFRIRLPAWFRLDSRARGCARLWEQFQSGHSCTLSTSGNAFNSRTASFIIQQHFLPA